MTVHLLGENCFFRCSGSDENCTLSALTSCKSKIGDSNLLQVYPSATVLGSPADSEL